jgi:hypothetical protein
MKDGAQILVALFAGMWGSFGMALRIVEMLNDRRDIVLGFQEAKNTGPANRKQLLLADWVPLWLSGLGFLLVAMIFFLAFPDIAEGKSMESSYLSVWRAMRISPLHAVSYASAVLAFVGFNALAWGGNADFKRMKSALQRSNEHPSIINLPKDRRTS